MIAHAPTGALVSIQVGAIRTLGSESATDPMDKTWRTGFFKQPVVGPIAISVLGLQGDQQADLVNHGGRDKAICAYSADHYSAWREELRIDGFDHGAFGENFTLAGLGEDQVCVGDVWRVGTTVVQVSQPRQPCWKLARRWRRIDLAARVIEVGKTGWYFRVLEPGAATVGDTLALIERSEPNWTISRANLVMHHRRGDADLAAELASVALLSESWRESLLHRVAKLR